VSSNPAESLTSRGTSGAFPPPEIDFFAEDSWTFFAAIKREERKLEKQLGKLNHQLSGVRAAAKALGHSAEREVIGAKKRVLSAAGRAAIVKAVL
jgi:hypothetical protein